MDAAAADAFVQKRTVMLDEDGWHLLAGPLREGAEALAVARRSRPFSDEEMEIFVHLAAHAAVSIENTALHERVREQAVVDELTGLANHRAFQDFLRHQLESSATPRVALVMLDIDDFKHVNDTYGHQQGDRVLRLVADTIRERSRAVDCPARYGGEELAVALPRTDIDGARRVAEELRAAIAALRLDMADGTTLRLSVSGGFAAVPASAEDQAGLIAAADSALYEAKRAGKNRVVAGALSPVSQRSRQPPASTTS